MIHPPIGHSTAPGAVADTGVVEAPELAGLLADPGRLRALSAVVLGAAGSAEVARDAGLTSRQAVEALHRLRAAGLVISGPDGLAVDHDALRRLARAAAPAQESNDLAPFVEGRQLRSLPAGRDRRWNVLAHVATHALQAGRDYPERELVEALRPWCEDGPVDTSALRRYLVEEGLVSRGSGIYRLGSDGPPLSEGERLVRGMGLE